MRKLSVTPLVLTASAALGCFVALSAVSVYAQDQSPSLLISNDPIPEDIKRKLYNRPSKVQDIRPNDLMNGGYYAPEQTLVSRKVEELRSELQALQGKIAGVSTTLTSLEKDSEALSINYYSNIATINAQLQNGTTPGNPRLVNKINIAEGDLEDLAGNIARLNQLAVDTAHLASEASFLLEETRAAYSLSGAIEEDHILLAQTEDAIANTIVAIERVLNTMNDDITRTTAYLSSERNNVRTLSLAVSNGDLYGKSLSSRPFSRAGEFQPSSLDQQMSQSNRQKVESSELASAAQSNSAGNSSKNVSTLSSAVRPLVKIRFDKPEVEYEQPVYMAVNEALERYPNASFELVAVNPTKGNAAQVAIESTRARRNAEKVLRTLTQMGLPLERIDLSYADNEQAQTNEVHLYIR